MGSHLGSEGPIDGADAQGSRSLLYVLLKLCLGGVSLQPALAACRPLCRQSSVFCMVSLMATAVSTKAEDSGTLPLLVTCHGQMRDELWCSFQEAEAAGLQLRWH